MPKLDGTGPKGEGPRTGRGSGDCPRVKQRLGQGWGRRLGLGRFCPRCPFSNNEEPSKEEKKNILEEEKKIIEQEIAELNS